MGTRTWLVGLVENHRRGIHHQMEMAEQAVWDLEREAEIATWDCENNPSSGRHAAVLGIAINKLSVEKTNLRYQYVKWKQLNENGIALLDA